MSIGIYKITNPNGKIYIGQSINIEKRISDYKKFKNCKNQILLYRSLIKYNPKNHIFEIIKECDINFLNDNERYFQEFYNVLDHSKGLNCRLTSSDDRKGYLSYDMKSKISLSNKGKPKHSERNKINLSLKQQGNSNMLGKTHSKETKQKMSKSQLGKIRTEETKQKMSESAKGKIKTIEWRQNISKSHPTKKSVIQYDLQGNKINEFISINEAARQTGYRVADISACCNNKQKTSFGFIWRFKVN